MTMIPENSPEADGLEGLIDRYGLASVISALAEICDGKADHIETNWQDRVTARPWRRAARALSAWSDTTTIKDTQP